MSMEDAEQWAAKRLGRAAVIDFVRSPSHEARVAYPRLLENVVARVGGRLAWAGSIDQQLVGHDLERFEDVLISEFPSAEVCLQALVERRGWQPETILCEIVSHIAEPWPSFAPPLAAVGFGAARLLGAGARIGREPVDLPDLEALGHEMEGGLGPDADQLRSLHDDADRAERVVMLNLLHFREHARYAPRDDAPAERTGRQAYGRYGRIAAPLIGREGGRLRWMARRMRALSDGPVTSWDQVAVVQYPSRSAFLRMIASARYRDATPHRNAALDRTRLLVCTSHAEFY